MFLICVPMLNLHFLLLAITVGELSSHDSCDVTVNCAVNRDVATLSISLYRDDKGVSISSWTSTRSSACPCCANARLKLVT